MLPARRCQLNGRCQGFLNEKGPCRASLGTSLNDSSLFNTCHSRRDADHKTGLKKDVASHDPFENSTKHAGSRFIVGDNAASKRLDHIDAVRRLPQHFLCPPTDGNDFSICFVNGHHGRLTVNNAPLWQENKQIARSQVHADVNIGKEP